MCVIMLPDMQFSFVARNGELFSYFRTSQPPVAEADIMSTNKDIKKLFKVDVRNARYSNEYNCHGLTFISRLGRFAYFNDDVTRLLAAHNYKLIGSALNTDIDEITVSSKIVRGDVIVYTDGISVQHTGIVWSVKKTGLKYKIKILSKWGDLSEYFHDYNVVPPSYGKTVQIWTDRKV